MSPVPGECPHRSECFHAGIRVAMGEGKLHRMGETASTESLDIDSPIGRADAVDEIVGDARFDVVKLVVEARSRLIGWLASWRATNDYERECTRLEMCTARMVHETLQKDEA